MPLLNKKRRLNDPPIVTLAAPEVNARVAKSFPRKLGGKRRARTVNQQAAASTSAPQDTQNAPIRTRKPNPLIPPGGPPRDAFLHPKLPLELFDAIMGYMFTPKDIVSVARVSKALCGSILREGFQRIFKHVRKHCIVGPIPDPTPNFSSEASYAAFIFDSGRCDVCQEHTTNMYASFALRMRLCSKPECRKGATKKHLVLENSSTSNIPLSMKIVPVIESDLCLQKHPASPQDYPNSTRWYRKKRYDAVKNEYKAACDSDDKSRMSRFTKKYRGAMANFESVMVLSVELFHWSRRYQQRLAQMKLKNKAIAQKHAAELKIQSHELFNTKTYGDLTRHRTSQLQEVSSADWKDVQAEYVSGEVDAIRKRKAARDALAQSEELHMQAKAYWDKLQATGELGILPTLYEFKHLRTVHPILRPRPVDPVHATMSAAMTAPLEVRLSTNTLFLSELRGWRTGTRRALYGMLGLKDEDALGEPDQEPPERVTALFRCKACDSTLNGPLKAPLDVKQVCGHECPAADRARVGKSFFVAHHFVKDEKAIAAVTKVLRTLGLEDGQDGSVQAFSEVGTRVKCLSCISTRPIIMHAEAVAGHSRRHENMRPEVLSEEAAREALAVFGDVDVGAVARAPEMTLEAVVSQATANAKTAKAKLRTIVAFGCRHCAGKAGTPRENDIVMAGSSAESDVEMGEVAEVEAQLTALERDGEVEPGEVVKNPYKRKKKTNRTKRSNVVWKHYHFDGVKAHLKTSHNVAVVRDEDLYFDWAECARLGYAKALPVESAAATA